MKSVTRLLLAWWSPEGWSLKAGISRTERGLGNMSYRFPNAKHTPVRSVDYTAAKAATYSKMWGKCSLPAVWRRRKEILWKYTS